MFIRFKAYQSLYTVNDQSHTFFVYTFIILGVGVESVITMFAFKQALQEKERNATIQDLVTQIDNKLEQDPQLSVDGMCDYLAHMIADKEHTYAKEKVIVSGNHSLEVDWDKPDFDYYHMSYRIALVEKYNTRENISIEEFSQERKYLKEKCIKAYNDILREHNEQK